MHRTVQWRLAHTAWGAPVQLLLVFLTSLILLIECGQQSRTKNTIFVKSVVSENTGLRVLRAGFKPQCYHLLRSFGWLTNHLESLLLIGQFTNSWSLLRCYDLQNAVNNICFSMLLRELSGIFFRSSALCLAYNMCSVKVGWILSWMSQTNPLELLQVFPLL